MNNVSDNLIILRSVFGKVGIKYYINPIKNPKTGRYPDCVRPVNSYGDMILSDKDRNEGLPLIPENKVFIIEDGKTFDLSNPWEKAEWESIEHCTLIAKSRDARDAKGNLIIDGNAQRYGLAELYIERPGYETNKKVSKKRKIHDASSYIFNDPEGHEGRIKMARLLGKNMKSMPDADVVDYLIEIAERMPERIINLYTGDEMHLRLLFMDARDKNVIYLKNKVFLYGESVVLGATDDAVISWMKDPKNYKVLTLIKQDTYPNIYEKAEQEANYHSEFGSVSTLEDIKEVKEPRKLGNKK